MLNFDETLPTDHRWQVSQRINEAFCPERWERVRLHELADVQNGFAFKSKFFSKGAADNAMPLIRIRDVGKDGTETYYSGEFEPEYVVRKGDIVIGMDGEFRCRKWRGRDALLNQRVCRLLPHGELVEFEFFFKLIQPYLDAVEQVTSSVTVAHLSSKTVSQLEFPFPPLAEQSRIVSAIESLQERSSRARVLLSEVGPLIGQLRQSVLRGAFSGRLTAAWREQRARERQGPDDENRRPESETADRPYETAHELLQRIRTERRERWEAEQLAKYEAKGKKPPKNWQDKYKEPEPVDESELPELPEGWCWCRMDELAANVPSAICAGPFGTIFKAKDFRPEGVPIIFLRHVAPGKYLTRKPGFMDPAKWKELFLPYSVHGGELLATKLGEPPGVACIYPEGIGAAMVTPDVMKLTANTDAVNTRFLMHYMNSDAAREFTFGIAYGATRLRMNLTIFRAMPVPLAPLAEQAAMVDVIDEHMATMERTANTCTEMESSLTQLDQSILSKAFRGELVPQDPRDEPAFELLARIRTTRKNAEAAKKASKKKPTRMKVTK